MYVAPRPEFKDDPWFAVRLACMPVIGFALGMAHQSTMLMLYPIMMFSLMASNRKGFNLGRVIGGPVAFTATLWLVSAFVAMLLPIPGALVLFMGLMYFIGFFIIQITGATFGMLFIVSVAMLGIMALGSYDAMAYMRNEMSKACLTLAWVAPIMYAIMPIKTQELHEDEPTPVMEPGHTTRALIRAVVLLIYSVAILAFLGFSDMILAIAGMFVIVHTGRQRMWQEVKQRCVSVLIGGGFALIILGVAQLVGHLWAILGTIFLLTLYLTHKMNFGSRFYYVYQDAASIMLSIGASALLTSDPAFAYTQRVVLTFAGTIIAAALVVWLDHALVGRKAAPQTQMPQTPKETGYA